MIHQFSSNLPQTEPRTPMDKALKYLAAPGPRTVREVERHLDACNFGEFEVAQTVERLKELSYLDDTAYAEEFIRTRLNTKPVSRAKLREQLLSHELPATVVDDALRALDDKQELANAADIARKYFRQLQHYEEPERKQRLLARLTKPRLLP